MIKGNRVGAVIVVLSCALAAPAAMAAPIAPGNGQQTVDVAGTRMTVFTYRPANCSDPSLLLVFHGVARNARTYRDYARPLAARSFLGRRRPTIDSSFMTRNGPRFPRKKPLTRRKQPTT